MSDYDVLVRARNRALAADRDSETHDVLSLFERALRDIEWMHPTTLKKTVIIARWYIQQPTSGEG